MNRWLTCLPKPVMVNKLQTQIQYQRNLLKYYWGGRGGVLRHKVYYVQIRHQFVNSGCPVGRPRQVINIAYIAFTAQPPSTWLALNHTTVLSCFTKKPKIIFNKQTTLVMILNGYWEPSTCGIRSDTTIMN